MRVGIDLIGGKLSSSYNSHKAAWAHVRKRQLEDEWGEVEVLAGESWDDFDLIYLYHGMEFKGSLNLFGGASEENAKFFERLVDPKPVLISLDIPMPDYGELCSSRKTADDYWKQIDWSKVSETCKKIDWIRHPKITTKVVMGDSHSFSAYQPGYMTFRKDGRTLRGVLRKTLENELKEHYPELDLSSLTHLTLYFGNIDVRHHLCRTSDPCKEVDILLEEYERQIIDLNIPNIELVKLLPIEPETRRIPKTGFFEGTAFFGTREERQKVVDYFNEKLEQLCIKNNFSFFKFDDIIYKVDPETYMKDYMEKPKNVHLSPLHHRTDLFGLRKQRSVIEF